MIRVEEGGSWGRGGGSNCCFSALVVLSFFFLLFHFIPSHSHLIPKRFDWIFSPAPKLICSW